MAPSVLQQYLARPISPLPALSDVCPGAKRMPWKILLAPLAQRSLGLANGDPSHLKRREGREKFC